MTRTDPPRDMSYFRLKVAPENIFLLSWIITSYEGIGHLTTEDPKNGTVLVLYPPGNGPTVKKIIDSLSDEGMELSILSEFHCNCE